MKKWTNSTGSFLLAAAMAFSSLNAFVMPVKAFETDSDMLKEFDWLLTNEQSIKKCLGQKIPEYLSELQKTRQIINNLK